jgi:hypothetical protein
MVSDPAYGRGSSRRTLNLKDFESCEAIAQTLPDWETVAMRAKKWSLGTIQEYAEIGGRIQLRECSLDISRKGKLWAKWYGRNLTEIGLNHRRIHESIAPMAYDSKKLYFKESLWKAGIHMAPNADDLLNQVAQLVCELSVTQNRLEPPAVPAQFTDFTLSIRS